MSDEGTRNIRGAIEGAGRAFKVIDGGGGGRGPTKPPDRTPSDRAPCPLVFLGHLDGTFHFLDARGQKRQLTARTLGNRHELLALFLGSDAWLRQEFPKKAKVKRQGESGEEVEVEIVVDFRINDATRFLIRECGERGLYGEHVVLRAPGVWPGAKGLPIVHCGDCVLIDGVWQDAGTRTDNQVWAAAAATARPALGCDVQVGLALQDDLKNLWNFRKPGGEIAVLGLIACGYLGAAARWRPAGFLLGGMATGKSSLLNVMRAASPLHYYTNDTTKAGIEQAISGRAMPMFIDEAADREDQRGARMLLDMVLAASGGEGTRGSRGGSDGQARSFAIAGSIVMAAISPPDMQPQHLSRFTLIELVRASAGEDHTIAHRKLVETVRDAAPALWGRVLSRAEIFQDALAAFRAELLSSGSAPREMDQVGALLAGWFVLTHEGRPTERDCKEGVAALAAFVSGADEVMLEDAPQRMVRHLVSSMVQLSRSTDRMQIGALIARVLETPSMIETDISAVLARNVLANHGIRVIRADEPKDLRGRDAPRAAHGNGVWFAPASVELRRLFAGINSWEGERWLFELKRLESAREPKLKVRVGSITARAVWVSAEELGFDDDRSPP
jgi:hypothetical protein